MLNAANSRNVISIVPMGCDTKLKFWQTPD
jgi:hypothetical protein